MSRLLYELFVFLVTYFCSRRARAHTHTHTHTHTHILHKEEPHVANIRTFHISGTYTLFSYLLSRGKWHNDFEVLNVSPLVLLLEMWSVALVLSAVPWKDGCMLHVPHNVLSWDPLPDFLHLKPLQAVSLCEILLPRTLLLHTKYYICL
jgi:hypothetical protein